MNASNSLLKYHKTAALSLSGKPHAEWQDRLLSQGITAWHDRTVLSPLTYLGYPICSSIAQRNVAFQKLYTMIQTAISIHSQRIVSIRGRSQLLSLRGLGTAFLNYRIFPRIFFALLSQPRANGGLGLLDPLKQQQALQWRWACPLLLDTMQSSLLSRYTVPSFPYLAYPLKWLYFSSSLPHPLCYFLFPSARSSYWFPHIPPVAQDYLNPFVLLLSCLSAFAPDIFDPGSIDEAINLSPPIHEICLPKLPTNHPDSSSFIPPDQLLGRPPGSKHLVVNDVFHYDAELQAFRVRLFLAPSARHLIVIKRLANMIISQKLRLQPFLRPFCFPCAVPLLDSSSPSTLRPLCRRLLISSPRRPHYSHSFSVPRGS
ncbi:hypothetical protein [Parasitella parasitica]|uniref:Uncharacterized protein n=1 Tax=Parasitella parasitica TaxID=35722 RepID=A0A0B7NBJ2_9FUNG|nr:hypothetical protein [Parasitella parasitica]